MLEFLKFTCEVHAYGVARFERQVELAHHALPGLDLTVCKHLFQPGALDVGKFGGEKLHQFARIVFGHGKIPDHIGFER